jgi:DNA-directed RNA polymerase specialized sigma24 family protein
MADADSIPAESQPAFAWPEDTENEWVRFLGEWDPVIAAVLNGFRFPADDELDIAQQVRAVVIQKCRSGAAFPTRAQFAAFLRRTTKGLCLNLIRKSRRIAGLPPELPAPARADDFGDDFPLGLPADERVGWLIEQADEKDRPLLRLYLIQGHNFAEIGVRLGCSKTTAHDRYRAAEQRLKRRLTDGTH